MHTIDTPGAGLPGPPEPHHRLRFASLSDPGQAVLVPCDAAGRVDLDGLSDKLRTAYLAARALAGRGYAYPVLDSLH